MYSAEVTQVKSSFHTNTPTLKHKHMHKRVHSHIDIRLSLLMFPCEMLLHDKEEAIRKPLKHYFLSVAMVTDLILQLQSLTRTFT